MPQADSFEVPPGKTRPDEVCLKEARLNGVHLSEVCYREVRLGEIGFTEYCPEKFVR